MPKHLFLILLPLIVSLGLTLSALLWIGAETYLHSWYLAARPNFIVVGMSGTMSEAEK
jgi:hypothetical protein